jgi:hypothetical protein
MIFLHILMFRDTFVPTKIVQKVGFLERDFERDFKRDFERDHLAEKINWTKMGQMQIPKKNLEYFS